MWENTATDITTSEVTSLCHEPGNHAVESRACVAVVLLACSTGTEIGCGLGDDIIIELKLDTAPTFHCIDFSIPYRKEQTI